MSVTKKALFVIERNHNRDLTLEDIATACGVTKYHLAHAFGQTMNLPVMQYMRGRRLTEAARALARGAPDILGLALESGYASHEAFTRAFRSQFGLAPESVRSGNSLDGLTLIEPMSAPSHDAVEVNTPRLVSEPEIRAVGLHAHYSYDATAGIPGQWQRFMTTLASAIPHRRPGIPIGVASGVDVEGNFDYICATEVTAFSTTPRDCVRVTIPAHRYAIFEHRGHVSALPQTYAAIWDELLPTHELASSDAPSIERHKETFDPRTGDGGVDI
ncbi:MAG TPA: AraC family transcriptional regulator, partial [Steroidobacteraceae bacterium]